MSLKGSSKRWLQAHCNDPYVKKAQAEHYRSRAVYKLKEIDEKDKLLVAGMVVVDLGAAPGGWSQYLSEKLKDQGRIIALDRLPMDRLFGVDFIQGDFEDAATWETLFSLVTPRMVDLVLSDMAPNMTGNRTVDVAQSMHLVELALDFADKMLKPGGTLLVKIFHGAGFEEVVKLAKAKFTQVLMRKPGASRKQSRETYLLAKGYNL